MDTTTTPTTGQGAGQGVGGNAFFNDMSAQMDKHSGLGMLLLGAVISLTMLFAIVFIISKAWHMAAK